MGSWGGGVGVETDVFHSQYWRSQIIIGDYKLSCSS